MKDTELLARTQMALGNTNPYIRYYYKGVTHISHVCIYCSHEYDNSKPPVENHEKDCIWIIAVISTGDYE